MNLANAKRAFAASDLVVIGKNPELADYDNPRGDIIGFRAYVVAEDARGYRWAHVHGFTSRWESEVLPRAECMAARVQAALDRGLGLDADLWREIQPCYGSSAYIREGCEAEAAFLEKMEDERGGW